MARGTGRSRGTTARPAPASAAPESGNPDELVDVIDGRGNPARVSRAWLERWPDDFRLASEPAPTGEPAPAPAQNTTEPPPAQDENGSATEPEQENK